MPAEGPAAGIGRRSVFVYYTLAADKAQRLQQAVALFASRPAPWRLELMRRADAGDPVAGSQTWMEVYTFDGAACDDEQTHDPAALVQLIEARARQAGLLELIGSERHCEVFESCA